MLVTIPIALPLQPRIEKSTSPDIGQALDADIHRALSPAKPSEEDENNLSPASFLSNPFTSAPADTQTRPDQPKQQN